MKSPMWRWRVSWRRFKRNKIPLFGIRVLTSCLCRGRPVPGRPRPFYNGSHTCCIVTGVIWRPDKSSCSHQINSLMIILTKYCPNWVNKTWFRWLISNTHRTGYHTCKLKLYSSGLKLKIHRRWQRLRSWKVASHSSTRLPRMADIWNKRTCVSVTLRWTMKWLFPGKRLNRFTTLSTKTTT